MSDTKAPKKGAPPCGLFLTLPENWMDVDFLQNFRDVFRAINASPYEKNSHVIEFRSDDGRSYTKEEIEIIAALSALAASQGVVFLVGGNDPQLAKLVGADGIILDNPMHIALTRAVLGSEAIVAIRCGLSRRIAEKAMEEGADCVGFGDVSGRLVDPGLIEWWHYKSSNPCFVEGAITNDNCDFYVAAGADFIGAGPYVWSHPEGAMKGIVNMAYAIDLALERHTEKKAS